MEHEMCCQIIEGFLAGHGWIQTARFDATSETSSLVTLFAASAADVGSVGSIRVVSRTDGSMVVRVVPVGENHSDFDNIGDACSLLDETRAALERTAELGKRWNAETTYTVEKTVGF